AGDRAGSHDNVLRGGIRTPRLLRPQPLDRLLPGRRRAESGEVPQAVRRSAEARGGGVGCVAAKLRHASWGGYPGKGRNMDLSFTPEELAFRDEARKFFRTAIPESIRAKVAEGEVLTKDDMVTAQRILNQHGWCTVNWPVEWGGKDWSPVQVYLYQDEMQQAHCPSPIAFNVSMVGPVIAQFGNQEQKERFLPKTANADIFWCQGFSEPGSGSDLASLRTRAERKGDKYVVNGQKIWTTLAQYADWIFCLVRTDTAAKQQEGISFILVDM